MSKREHIEGLMAASLYEPLTAAEQAELDAWMAAHPEDRAELEALRDLMASLPVEAPVFTGDLRGVLREEILRGAGRGFSWSFSPRLLFQVAGTLAVAAILVLPVWQGVNMGFLSPGVEQSAGLEQTSESVLSQAQGLLASGQHAEAHAYLSEKLNGDATNPEAGRWQMLLAKLEFEHYNRYAQAWKAYEKLRGTYGDTFASSPENAYRFDLLEQTRDAQFMPLYTVARARELGAEAFPELERVVARYSGRGNPVAELALYALCDISGALNPSTGVFQLASYEQVRRRFKDPIAIAQLNDRMGQLYLDHTGDVERARQLFREVLECGDTPLAAAAQVSLARLEISAPRP